MIRSYLSVALRTLKRQPGYSAINVVGLAVGVACCLLIVLFVRDEISYDRFNEKADRIVRATLYIPQLDREIEVTPTIVGPLFERTFPEVEDMVRVYDVGRFRKVTVRTGAESWQESGFMYADSSIFSVFTLPFVWGNPATALSRPNTLVLTESTAIRYFGSAGAARERVLTIDRTDYQVTGVIEDVPAASHLRFDILASFVSTRWASREIWDSANFYTYLVLTSPGAVNDIRVSSASLLDRYKASSGLRSDFDLRFQRLTDIYLVYMGRERYVWLFSALALLILAIACINHVNLSTARVARRAREVGIRKALGAQRAQIIGQFLGESTVIASAALFVGIALAALLLPAFNTLSGKNMDLSILGEPVVWGVAAILLVVVTVGAGLYPAMLVGGFRPAAVLKAASGVRTGGGSFRRGLVVFQFAVTVFLFVATAAVFGQLSFISTTDVGFDRDRVVVLPLADSGVKASLPLLRQRIASDPAVVVASAMNAIPGEQRGGYSLFTGGAPHDQDDRPDVVATPVDAQVVETIGLELLAGPGFAEPFDYLAEADSGRYQYVVNEELVRTAGWTIDTAVGQRMGVSPDRMGEVVGVIRNYNFATLHERIEPLALFVEPSWNVLLVKIAGGDVAATLSTMRATWREVTGESPFTYTFLDDDYNGFYDSERRLGRVFGGASVLAILIACLGLLGLASHTAERRRREIGIRKVLGATVPGVVTLLNREFTLLVLVAVALASPLAWWASNQWLEGFTYRTHLSWTTFAAAGGLCLLLAWLTVAWQSVRAATADPATVLRNE